MIINDKRWVQINTAPNLTISICCDLTIVLDGSYEFLSTGIDKSLVRERQRHADKHRRLSVKMSRELREAEL